VSSQSVWVNTRLATLFPGLSFPTGGPSSSTNFVEATSPASDERARVVTPAWPASDGRAGMLTQPGFLWSASDPAVPSIVHRGKFIHDDVLCQDDIPMKIALSTSSAMNVINCKSPDGTMTLAACDSEVLQSDARMTNQRCKACHSQMDPYARGLLDSQ